MTSVSVSVTNLWPCCGQFPLQVEIVFDDAVMHHHDASGAVAMRMGILLCRPAMRCPARMADAECALRRMVMQNASSRLRSLPGARHTASLLLAGLPTAIPAESYPRYSRRLNPSMMTGTTFFGPTYPTIPHMYRFYGTSSRLVCDYESLLGSVPACFRRRRRTRPCEFRFTNCLPAGHLLLSAVARQS